MKKLIIAALMLGASMTTGAAFADNNEISANVALATDYRFRGISQTNRDPAIQGGFDYAHESGVYIGTWASNVSFTEGGTEIDFYAGWGTDLSDDTSIDLGYLYYSYPSSNFGPGDRADYWELYGSFGFYGATIGLNYSPEYTFGTGEFWYIYGQYSFPLGEVASLDLHLAYNSIEELDSFLGGEDTGDGYIDYSIGITAGFAGLDWTLAYIGTDIDKSDCFGGDKACEGNAVVSVSKSF